MNNVAMHQNGVYIHDINKLLTFMTTNTIGASVEAEHTSQGVRYVKTNFQLCSNNIQYTLQRVDSVFPPRIRIISAFIACSS